MGGPRRAPLQMARSRGPSRWRRTVKARRSACRQNPISVADRGLIGRPRRRLEQWRQCAGASEPLLAHQFDILEKAVVAVALLPIVGQIGVVGHGAARSSCFELLYPAQMEESRWCRIASSRSLSKAAIHRAR